MGISHSKRGAKHTESNSGTLKHPLSSTGKLNRCQVILNVGNDRLLSFHLPVLLFESHTPRNLFTTRYVPVKQNVHSVALEYSLDRDRRMSRMVNAIDPIILPVFETLESSTSNVFFVPSDIDPVIKENATVKYEEIVSFNKNLVAIIKDANIHDNVDAFDDCYRGFYIPGNCGKLLVSTLLDAIFEDCPKIVDYIMKVDSDLVEAQQQVIYGAIEAIKKVDSSHTLTSPMEHSLRLFFREAGEKRFSSSGSSHNLRETHSSVPSAPLKRVVFVDGDVANTHKEPFPVYMDGSCNDSSESDEFLSVPSFAELPDHSVVPEPNFMTDSEFAVSETEFSSKGTVDTAPSRDRSGTHHETDASKIVPVVSEPDVRFSSEQLEPL